MNSHQGPSLRRATQVSAATAFALVLLALGPVASRAQDQKDPPKSGDAPPKPPAVKLGLSVNDAKAFQGYTLLAPMMSTKTYLLDMEGRVVRTWESDCNPALCAYLLEDGHLLRPGSVPQTGFGFAPGLGGKIQEFTWEGELVWDYRFSNATQYPHHDICRLPNGNVLMIVAERKTSKEAVAGGRRPETVGDSPLQPDYILEIERTGKSSGKVVWEWHA
ncbi:MAG TPA: aryl-sulfate sulfotransferase, partial [Gemmataceae bacterium]|nr:aryl-sulfate sulfotransferase [Gemmataceae bacterium]